MRGEPRYRIHARDVAGRIYRSRGMKKVTDDEIELVMRSWGDD